MRSISHWTPRYIKDRLGTIYYEKKHRDHPWLPRSANEILDSYLTKSDIGLEFGSGRSTIWFAKRISHLTSVEDNENWVANVREMLNKTNTQNVDYKFLPNDGEEDNGSDVEYVRVIDNFEANSLDFCLVDGSFREFCTLNVIEKIHPGGLLIIDNVNWYLPSNTYSPFSRSLADGPKNPIWNEVANRLSNWRKIWISSGVTDTAFFFKPFN